MGGIMSKTNCSECSDETEGRVILKPPPISPSIRWCMTLNNPSDDDIKSFSSICSKFCKFAIVGLEVGESGTPHLQGYIEFKKKSRPMSVFSNKKIHWEKSKATKYENWTYCTKDGNIKIQVGEGFEPVYELDLKLKPWQIKIVEILNEEPDDRTIRWYWEPEGGIGKTVFQKYCFLNMRGVTVLGGSSDDMRNGIIQYEKNNEGRLPKIVFINLPRSSRGVCYKGLEQIKDMFFYSGKYEGGMICGRPPHVMVFANEPPDDTKLSTDRLIVERLWDD